MPHEIEKFFFTSVHLSDSSPPSILVLFISTCSHSSIVYLFFLFLSSFFCSLHPSHSYSIFLHFIQNYIKSSPWASRHTISLTLPTSKWLWPLNICSAACLACISSCLSSFLSLVSYSCSRAWQNFIFSKQLSPVPSERVDYSLLWAFAI